MTELWTRENLAWAAGLFEGEGCASLLRDHRAPRTAYTRLTLGSTDLDVIEKFHAIIGLGRVSGRPSRHANRKAMSYWRVHTFEETQAVAAALWPWLCARRHAALSTALLGDSRRTPTLRPRLRGRFVAVAS